MLIINTRTLRGYLQGISGLFISKDNPGGLTPKELDILTAFMFVMKDDLTKPINAEHKAQVASLTNHPVQVITNYVKKLRDKKVLMSTNKLQPILKYRETTITFKSEDKDNLQSSGV